MFTRLFACLLTGLAVVSVAGAGSFSESFDVLDADGLPAGWTEQNLSDPVGVTDWFTGNPAVFTAQAGANYIGANYNNTTTGGTISNWLISPVVSLDTGDILSFHTRAADQLWPDRLEVRLSTAGASTDAGATALSVGDFTTLLLTVNPDLNLYVYPEVWTQFSAAIPADFTGRLAFRYFVTNGGPSGANANYIGVDSLNVTGIPEPASLALLLLGAVGLLRRRR